MGLVTSGKLETFLVGVGSHGVFFTGQGMLAGAQGAIQSRRRMTRRGRCGRRQRRRDHGPAGHLPDGVPCSRAACAGSWARRTRPASRGQGWAVGAVVRCRPPPAENSRFSFSLYRSCQPEPETLARCCVTASLLYLNFLVILAHPSSHKTAFFGIPGWMVSRLPRKQIRGRES